MACYLQNPIFMKYRKITNISLIALCFSAILSLNLTATASESLGIEEYDYPYRRAPAPEIGYKLMGYKNQFATCAKVWMAGYKLCKQQALEKLKVPHALLDLTVSNMLLEPIAKRLDAEIDRKNENLSKLIACLDNENCRQKNSTIAELREKVKKNLGAFRDAWALSSDHESFAYYYDSLVQTPEKLTHTAMENIKKIATNEFRTNLRYYSDEAQDPRKEYLPSKIYAPFHALPDLKLSHADKESIRQKYDNDRAAIGKKCPHPYAGKSRNQFKEQAKNRDKAMNYVMCAQKHHLAAHKFYTNQYYDLLGKLPVLAFMPEGESYSDEGLKIALQGIKKNTQQLRKEITPGDDFYWLDSAHLIRNQEFVEAQLEKFAKESPELLPAACSVANRIYAGDDLKNTFTNDKLYFGLFALFTSCSVASSTTGVNPVSLGPLSTCGLASAGTYGYLRYKAHKNIYQEVRDGFADVDLEHAPRDFKRLSDRQKEAYFYTGLYGIGMAVSLGLVPSELINFDFKETVSSIIPEIAGNTTLTEVVEQVAGAYVNRITNLEKNKLIGNVLLKDGVVDVEVQTGFQSYKDQLNNTGKTTTHIKIDLNDKIRAEIKKQICSVNPSHTICH